MTKTKQWPFYAPVPLSLEERVRAVLKQHLVIIEAQYEQQGTDPTQVNQTSKAR